MPVIDGGIEEVDAGPEGGARGLDVAAIGLLVRRAEVSAQAQARNGQPLRLAEEIREGGEAPRITRGPLGGGAPIL